MEKYKSLGSYIIGFIIVNLVLWGGQELYWRKDTKEINKIEKNLVLEKKDIDSLELNISNQSDAITKKQEEMDYLKQINSVDEYNSNVDEYNYLLSEYKTNIDIYENKLNLYNEQVDHENELIKKSGSRWYLIPIPIPSKSTHSKIIN